MQCDGGDGGDGEPLLTQLNIDGVVMFSLSSNKIILRITMFVVSTVFYSKFYIELGQYIQQALKKLFKREL